MKKARKKTFKVRIKVSESCWIKLPTIDTDEWNVDEISFDEADENIAVVVESYVSPIGIGNNWSDEFELKVYDDEDKLVYESNNFDDFKFITSVNDLHDETFVTNADLNSVEQICEELWKQEDEEFNDGYSLLSCEIFNFDVFTFTVEDDEFDPSKLLFIKNSKVDGVWDEFMTDRNHVVYNDRLMKPEADWEGEGFENDCLCRYLCVMNKSNGVWRPWRKLDLVTYGINPSYLKTIPEFARKQK